MATRQPDPTHDDIAPSLRSDDVRPGALASLPKQKAKHAPTIRVVAAEDHPASEWGSLLSDFARGRRDNSDEVEWRIHDRTHLEFAIDYPFDPSGDRAYAWEAFFFVPDSFRLRQTTYDKKQIYDDLLSYVRLAIPEVPFAEIARACREEACDAATIGELRSSIRAAADHAESGPEAKLAVRRLRVFACVVRASGLSAQRRMLALLEDTGSEEGHAAVATFTRLAQDVATGYRALLADASTWSLPSDVEVASRWVDEDLSLFLETLFATASVRMQQRPGGGEVAARLATEAVAEARYRRDRAYPSVGSAHATARDAEHIEFRRHVLKRFTSSVFWLEHEVRDGATWVMHGLYAFAAAIAMAFAVFATLHATDMEGYFMLSFALLVVSYAVKDRMKAMLQTALSRWAEKRFPDRHWTVKDEERSADVGVVEERAGFRDFDKLPESVLSVRRVTREHALEEHARREAVLWHEKRVVVGKRAEGEMASPVMTEIFRLNLGPWLAHTDDPNRTITFADPDQAVVCSATARRVYNVNVIYRLGGRDGTGAWKRIRVVVSRKGIERIDPIVR